MTNPDSKLRVAFLALARTTFDMELANETIDRARENLMAAGMTLLGPSGAITAGYSTDAQLEAMLDALLTRGEAP